MPSVVLQRKNWCFSAFGADPGLVRQPPWIRRLAGYTNHVADCLKLIVDFVQKPHHGAERDYFQEKHKSSRSRFASRSYGVPSRFLREIPSSVSTGRGERGAASSDTDTRLDYSYAQGEPGEAPELAIGLRVRHPIFGPGTVQGIAGSGPSTKLRIRFERAGLKTLMLRYANLELG